MLDWLLRTKTRKWPWIGLKLSIIYIFLVWSLPCLNAVHCGSNENNSQQHSEITPPLTIRCIGDKCSITREDGKGEHYDTCWNGPVCWVWSAGKVYALKIWEDPIALFTALLVLSTIALWRSTDKLWLAGEKQIRAAKSAAMMHAMDMRNSLAVAQSVAKAANKSASIAEDSFRRLERPYLFIKFTDMKNLKMPGTSVPHLFYTLVNYGKSPAILRAVSIGLQFNPEFPLRTTMASYDEFYDVIEPGQFLPGQRTLAVAGAEPGRAFKGNERTLLILHGIIEYEDPTGALHIDGIVMRANRDDTFRIDGGSEYNWHKTEYPRPKNGKKT